MTVRSSQAAAAEESAEPKQQKTRLMEAKAPQYLRGFIPRAALEIFAAACVKKIDQMRIPRLIRVVNDFTNK